MKLNLRKANALQNNLGAYISNLDIKNTVNITQFEDAELVLADALSKALNTDGLRDQLLSAQFNIRALIGAANATAGVDNALARAAYLDRRIAQLEQFIGSGERIKTEVLSGKLDKMRNRKDDVETRRSIYGYEDSVMTSVFDTATLTKLKADIKALKKEKQAVNDKVLELNVRTEITIPDDEAQLLTNEGLI